MKRIAEKINEKRMGGLMKIRLLAVVLGAIAIMTSGVAFADDDEPGYTTTTMPLNIPIKVKGFTLDFSGMSTGGNQGKNNDFSAWKCSVEQVTNMDRVNDTLDTVVDGLLGWKALANTHQRDVLQYTYLNNVAALNNTWRMMDSALNYSTQQQLAYYQYRYGQTYANYGRGANYNQGIQNYASDTYNNFSDNWWNY